MRPSAKLFFCRINSTATVSPGAEKGTKHHFASKAAHPLSAECDVLDLNDWEFFLHAKSKEASAADTTEASGKRMWFSSLRERVDGAGIAVASLPAELRRKFIHTAMDPGMLLL
jgi:hypothetical protein